MRASMLAGGAVLLLLGAGAAFRASRHDARPPAPPPGSPAPAADSRVLGVDEFMEGVDRFRGPVSLEGVVRTVAQDRGLLSLVDAAEFEECGSTACARWTLPVRWSGPMPKEEETVRVEGQVAEAGGRMVFVARKLEPAAARKEPAR